MAKREMAGRWMAGAAAAALLASGAAARAQAATATPPAGPLTTPQQALGGHTPGEDYFLATYDQLAAYWRTLAKESPRARLVSLGETAEGRDQLMMVVSAPANLAKLDRLKEIARTLGAGRVSEAEAKALAAEGRALVWIDASLHAEETAPAQSHLQLAYDLLSKNDPETLRLLQDDVILLPIINPDGMQLITSWYMREPEPTKRTNSGLPVLYQKYIGHDVNRDFYASAQAETTNTNRALWRDWRPQVVLDEHQRGPYGAVVFLPPLRDPLNYHYDPLVTTDTNSVAFAVHDRLIRSDRPGSLMGGGAPYSSWANGTLHTAGYFHNTPSLLTEIIGEPNPTQAELMPRTQLAHEDLPAPMAPQTWHMRQTIDYTLQINLAVMDYASKNREQLQLDSWIMARNAVRRGSQDSWTTTPTRIATLEAAGKTGKTEGPEPLTAGFAGYDGRLLVDPKLYEPILHAPEARDPRGYVIPADQPDLPTAVRFLNALLKNGVEVKQATAAFTAGGKTYPAGSYVVKTDQAFRPYVLDMFEPQDYPKETIYPGGPPVRLYDVTGYTLAFQMGVTFDRVLDGFDGPFAAVPDVIAAPPPGRVVGRGGAGWLLDHAPNNDFILINRLMKAGQKAAWLRGPVRADGRDFAPGALWVPATAVSRAEVERAVQALGLTAYALPAAPAGERIALKPVRIGLADFYGGSIPAGWMRWLFDQFEFPYTQVFPQRFDAGDLRRDYDVLVFADAVIPAARGFGRLAALPVHQPPPEAVPPEYRDRLGRYTAAALAPKLAAFAKAGGVVAGVGASSLIGGALGLPVETALTEPGPDGAPQPISTSKFYIPGSLLHADVDTAQPLAFGLPRRMDVFFDSSPVFRITGPGATKVAGFGGADVLHSGVAWGQEMLNGTTAVVDADLGRGKVFLFGPEVTMRGQPDLSFKFLFNALYYGPAVAR